jgi:hypothetical protein
MLWVIAAIAASGVAAWAYLYRERMGPAGLGLAGLRTLAFVGIAALLANVALGRRVGAGPTTVLLDASLSMQGGSRPWRAVLDTARVLAGRDGLVMRFGRETAPFDSGPPTAGASRLGDALRVAAARGGPVVVLTDGELDDWETLPEAARQRAQLMVLPRDSVPGLAVTEVVTRDRVLTGDSVIITLEVATWGGLADTMGVLRVRGDGRDLLRRPVPVPAGAGRGRRSVVLAPGSLPPGVHVLDVSITADGDPTERDNLRQRVIEITALPAAVVVADPVDWEARFLTRELADLVPGGLEAFGHLGADRWVDLRTQRVVPAERVARLRRGAALVVTRGAGGSGRRTWRWIGGEGGLGGDWYVTADLAASALVPRLAGVAWDSLPPVRDVRPVDLPGYDAVLSARLGRRGAQRVVLAARDSAGRRDLVTTAEGFWRWAFRGGAAREAYRAMLAAGVEWLLRGVAAGQAAPIVVAPMVTRGLPVPVWWVADEIPAESLTVTFAGRDTVVERRIVFGADGAASVDLPVGAYRWRLEGVAGASGAAVVEAFSPEFVPRTPVLPADGAPVVAGAGRVQLRELWWVFGVAALALMAEWAWRLRRGLP